MQTRPSSRFFSIVMRTGIVAILLASSASLSHFSRAGSADIAPGTSTSLDAIADTFIASGQPDRNWAGLRTFWIGHDQSGGYGREESLIKFDANAIPQGSRVTSAVLSLYLSAIAPGNDTPMKISAFRINENWEESVVTWNNRPTLVGSVASAEVVVPAEFGWYQWDLTTALQSWLDGPPNVPFSVLLRGDKTDGQHERAFWSKDCSDSECSGNRPHLDVQWAPPPPPTPTPTATPTATPRPPRLDVHVFNTPIGPVPPGGLITYTIRYENTGGEDLTNVVITGSIPAHTELLPSSYEDATPVGGSLRWEVGSVAKDAWGTRSYSVRVKSATVFGAALRAPRPTTTLTPSLRPTATPAAPQPSQ